MQTQVVNEKKKNIYIYYNKMKLTVQLIERMNATRKLTMAMGQLASQLARFKFKITEKEKLCYGKHYALYKYLS